MEEKFADTKKKAGILGIIGNIFLLIIKATVGFISKSQAMIADSVNSAVLSVIELQVHQMTRITI